MIYKKEIENKIYLERNILLHDIDCLVENGYVPNKYVIMSDKKIKLKEKIDLIKKDIMTTVPRNPILNEKYCMVYNIEISENTFRICCTRLDTIKVKRKIRNKKINKLLSDL